MGNFFDTNSYFIDEKVNFFKMENSYQVFNDKAENIGAVMQKLSTGQKILRMFISKAMLPFLLEIKDSNGNIEASITRGWTFFMSKMDVLDANGIKVGAIHQKFAFLKPTFKIYDASDALIAEIKGDWKAWNFAITDANGSEIGTISKKWAGAMKELFTSADKYNVNIAPGYSNKNNKIAILSSAICIDMILKEKK